MTATWQEAMIVRTIVLATRNTGKAGEITATLGLADVKFLTLQDFPLMPEVEEDGATFEENALKKARAVARHCNCPALADDSGLEVDALNGLPGVRSARFAGEEATDAENNSRLAELMQPIPAGRRGARFVCVLALVDPSGEETVVRGECEGCILESPRGTGGFGYDPLFFYPPLGRTFAEMLPEEKNRVSHRARALEGLRDLLIKQGTHA